MAFLDEVVVWARSGDGGAGCVSFLREKYKPRGGPDGGDGGNGGSVFARAVGATYSLSNYISKRKFRARNGEPGKGKNRTGRSGADLVLELPPGTLIHDAESGELIAELMDDGQELLLIPGGRGGKGNQHFATPVQRAPRYAQAGEPGHEKTLRLTLKFIAHIGLIGLPNVGKSTILSRLTMARPKIEDYPFTTLTPNLGVMDLDEGQSLIVADIPGLIEGAGEGRGLGHRFLKHVERTRLLLHILDITFHPQHELLEDFETVRREMARYNPELAGKPVIVLMNKIDLSSSACRDPETLRVTLKRRGFEAFAVSALTGEGLDGLKKAIAGVFNRKEGGAIAPTHYHGSEDEEFKIENP
jgi:GTP-binding protein